jgi:alpha-L-rhamnosidase
MRREFTLASIVAATVHVCGLGHYELRIDGEKIGARVVDPAWTDYKRVCAITRSHALLSVYLHDAS